MQLTEENLGWALALFENFRHKSGFPFSDNALQAEVKVFLRLVGDQPNNHYEEFDEERLAPVEKVFIGASGKESGERLIEEALIRCGDRFPSNLTLRRIYEDLKYQPADGLKSAEIATMEGKF